MDVEVASPHSSKSSINNLPERKFKKNDIKFISQKKVSTKNLSYLKSDDHNVNNKQPKTPKNAENYIFTKILKDMEKSIQTNNLKYEDVSPRHLNRGRAGIIPKRILSVHSLDKSKNSALSNNQETPKKFSIKLKKFKKVKKKKHIKNPEKNRVLLRSHILYDSFDEEKEKHKTGFFIDPDSTPMIIFDTIIYIYSSIYVIYIPYRIANMKCFCDEFNYRNFNRCFIRISDFINSMDIIISFLKGYYNFKFQVITDSQRIISHYLKTFFFFDFTQCIPEFVIINLICNNQNKMFTCTKYEMDYTHFVIIILFFLKSLKILKVIRKKQNSIIRKIKSFLIDFNKLSEIFGCYQFCYIIISMIHCLICLHLFIGNHNYPNWIMNSNAQDRIFVDLYIHSIYILFTTLTTVGYGDTPPASFAEIVLQICLLAVGVIAYSFIISTISSYVKKETRASIKKEQDENLLKELTEEYKIPNKLFFKIYVHLKTKAKAFEKCDKNILINSLPFSLRNQVLLTIYNDTKTNFKFFNKCQNNDFIIRTISSFIPFISKKNAIIIGEGQIIENIIFVNQGSLSFEASINKNKILESASKYIMINFEDISDDDIRNDESSISRCGNVSTDMKKYAFKLTKIVNGKYASQLLSESKIEEELGKCDYGEIEEKSYIDEEKYKFLKVLNIYRNESFGIIYMFSNKQSPLSLRVNSRKAELFLLRKYDALSISMLYPNIWKNIERKEYKNIRSIKKKTIKIIETYCISNGINLSNNISFDQKYLRNNSLNISSLVGKFGRTLNNKSTSNIKGSKKNIRKNKKRKKRKKVSFVDFSNKSSVKSVNSNFSINDINLQNEINNGDNDDNNNISQNNNKENKNDNKDDNKKNNDDSKNEENNTNNQINKTKRHSSANNFESLVKNYQEKLKINRQVCLSSKRVVRRGAIADVRIAHLKKLKAEIDFNEREKKKYKKLYEQLIQEITKKFSGKNKSMSYENFIEIKKQVEISNEVYKDDDEINIENEFIQVNVENFSINSIYNNLHILTTEENTYDKNVRKKASKDISNNMNYNNNVRSSKKNTQIIVKPDKNFFNAENFVKKRGKTLIIKKNESEDIMNFQAFSKRSHKKRKADNINFSKYHNEYISKSKRNSNASDSSIKDKNDSITDKDI